MCRKICTILCGCESGIKKGSRQIVRFVGPHQSIIFGCQALSTRILVIVVVACVACLDSLVFCVRASEPGAASSSAMETTLSVMSWNLEWFYDESTIDNFSNLAKEKSAPTRADWDWRRDAIAAAIASVKPTVCAVQEVESRRTLWYLTRSLEREHRIIYDEVCPESKDAFTEQDVGFLYRQPAELLSTTLFSQTGSMRQSGQYFDVSKHVMAVLEVPSRADKSAVERVTIMNVHLRSTADGESIRFRQARLIYHWLSTMVQAGENVIALGDFNTELGIGQSLTSADETLTDIAIAAGYEAPDKQHRLIDLHTQLDSSQRQTHLLPGRAFDRILVSRALVDDDPNRRDLVLDRIEVRRDLTIQGQLDEPQMHWDKYWQLPSNERDLSDHFPIIATFKIQ